MNTNAVHTWLERLSWMSPPLGLALIGGLVAALLYMTITAQRLRLLPLYWCLGIAGLAAGQILSQAGLDWFDIGNFGLGTGLVACILLFIIVRLLTLWYTEGHRSRPGARREPLRRGKL